jgi:hypothetical protein
MPVPVTNDMELEDLNGPAPLDFSSTIQAPKVSTALLNLRYGSSCYAALSVYKFFY